MKKLNAYMKVALVLLAVMSFGIKGVASPMEPVDYVSTLVGTQSDFQLSTGNTYPAIAMPWGLAVHL